MSDQFTIAHLTDAHLPTHDRFHLRELLGKRAFSALNWRLRRHRTHRRDVADALQADILTYQPDHVAMTGDVVNFGLPREFEAGAGWLDRFGSPADVSFVPGNHEAIHAGVEAERQLSFARFTTSDSNIGREWPWVRRRGLVTLIGLSTSIPTAPFLAQGEVGPDQIDGLRKALRGAVGTLAIILIHHPPTGVTISRKDLRDRRAVAAAIAESEGALVLHGHNHKNQLSWIDGASGRYPVLGSPSASVPTGEHFQPAEWRQISVSKTLSGWDVKVLRRAVGQGNAFSDIGLFTLQIPASPESAVA
jgi:3',5'-cyclic AMP phosphodiesterase CpdA